jgi:soluble lytic murein transglycosylase-like protein
MQLMPATTRAYGARNPFDPVENIEGAALFLRHLMVKYRGNLPVVLAAYNAGEGAVDRAGGRVPNIPETLRYVRRGMSLLRGEAA